MITILTTGSPAGRAALDGLFSRIQSVDTDCRDQVAAILADVQRRGDEAIIDYSRRFDAPELTRFDLPISSTEMEAAYRAVDASFLETLDVAIDRIREFHEREMEDSWLQTRTDGSIVGRLVRPVDSGGLYVPGGLGGSTPLVSSVLMNGIPAGIAGVARRVMVTPPSPDGSVNPYLLVAAGEIGISEIYKAGSAWAIGALAYGSETIAPVDVIVGPGNRFVAEAKRQVAGLVRIDMIAGPSEVLIVADQTANPAYIAADMLAQAEHDSRALAVVITIDALLPQRIVAELDRQLGELSRADTARAALAEHGRIFVASALEEAIELANDIAAEHLELQIGDPWSQLPHIRHAGAIFLGSHTPEAAGDYLAGPNHVLPTMGTARFASALGVETFLKKSSIISYSAAALAGDADHIRALARLEGLTAHAASVTRRVG
jgi:histidinol dehydrogenase